MTTRSHTITINRSPIREVSAGLFQLVLDGQPFDIDVAPYGPSYWRVRIFQRGEEWNESIASFPDAHSALWDTIGCVCDTLAAEREERAG